ncbi:hypothetical protein Droror1_Dr00026823, partial [Drosera rotundifolia]
GLLLSCGIEWLGFFGVRVLFSVASAPYSSPWPLCVDANRPRKLQNQENQR